MQFNAILFSCKKYLKCKIQYVGKTETPFHIRLNGHHLDEKNPTEETIPADKHFTHGHTFNKEAKFTIIEQIKNNNKSPKETITIILNRENFWIQRLQTLTPSGLNQELN